MVKNRTHDLRKLILLVLLIVACEVTTFTILYSSLLLYTSMQDVCFYLPVPNALLLHTVQSACQAGDGAPPKGEGNNAIKLSSLTETKNPPSLFLQSPFASGFSLYNIIIIYLTTENAFYDTESIQTL